MQEGTPRSPQSDEEAPTVRMDVPLSPSAPTMREQVVRPGTAVEFDDEALTEQSDVAGPPIMDARMLRKPGEPMDPGAEQAAIEAAEAFSEALTEGAHGRYVEADTVLEARPVDPAVAETVVEAAPQAMAEVVVEGDGLPEGFRAQMHQALQMEAALIQQLRRSTATATEGVRKQVYEQLQAAKQQSEQLVARGQSEMATNTAVAEYMKWVGEQRAEMYARPAEPVPVNQPIQRNAYPEYKAPEAQGTAATDEATLARQQLQLSQELADLKKAYSGSMTQRISRFFGGLFGRRQDSPERAQLLEQMTAVHARLDQVRQQLQTTRERQAAQWRAEQGQ